MDWEVERSRLTEPLSFKPDLHPGSYNNWGESVSFGICSIPGAVGVPPTGHRSRSAHGFTLTSPPHVRTGCTADARL